MLKNILKVLLLFSFILFSGTVVATSQQPPSSCQTPLLSSKPTLGKVAQLFEGVGWCCGFEAASKYPHDAAAAVRQMTNCYYLNSGIKAILVDLPTGSVHYKGNTAREDKIWSDMWNDVWGIVLDALMSTPVTSQWYGQLKMISNQQPNCAYWNGMESARQCYADFKNHPPTLPSPQSESSPPPSHCTIRLESSACVGSSTKDLVLHATGSPDVTNIRYAIQSNSGYQQTGSCNSASCEIKVTSDKVHSQEVFTFNITGTAPHASCQASRDIAIGDKAPPKMTFSIDPLLYEIKGMSETLNPYDDQTVTTYDDLLLHVVVPGIDSDEARNTTIDYEITGGNYFDRGKLTYDDHFEQESIETGQPDEGREAAPDYTEEIQRRSPEGLKRDQPHAKYDSCQLEATIPVANKWTHRGETWQAKVWVKTKGTDGKEQVLKEATLPPVNVAALNILFLKHTSANVSEERFVSIGKTQFGHFLEIARQTGGPLQSADQVKLLFRPEGSCSVASQDDLPSCAKNLKEHWNQEDTLAGLHAQEAVASYFAGKLFFTSDEEWDLAHELGHTYGLCDEYTYSSYRLENIGSNVFYLIGDCRNIFPTCCNDHPDLRFSKEDANDCFNIFHAEMGVSQGKTWYSDTLPVIPGGENHCIGKIIGCDNATRACGIDNIGRSIMGNGTASAWIEKGMRDHQIKLQYPEGIVIPVPRKRGNQ